MQISRILVSNISLPSNKIGSWTNMFDYFNKNDPFFDFILSPGINEGRYIHCSKNKWPFYFKIFRKLLLKYWVAKDFLKTLKKLSNQYDLLKIVVQDDISLLEAIVINKNSFSCEFELIFHFHGYYLQLPKFVDESLDKILFLSKSSYRYTLDHNIQLTPESFIVGNFILNEKFSYPKINEKRFLRDKFNIPFNSVVITWMANDRRVKGLHLFKKMVEPLLKIYPDLFFLIIGSNTDFTIINDRIKNIGRVHHDLLADYLKTSDFYFFTSMWKEGFGLSVLEAKYCGNWILSSNSGSLNEVLDNLSNVYFINDPNVIYNWLVVFHKAYLDFKNSPLYCQDVDIKVYSYNNWVDRFKSAVG